MKLKFVAVAIAAAVVSTAAQAATLINNSTYGLYNNSIGTVLDGTNPYGGSTMFPLANGASGDPYLNIPSSAAPDLSKAATALGSWLTNPTAPGGTWSGMRYIPSGWVPNTETAIIYKLEGGATGLTNVFASFGVDNGIFAWLNGRFLGGHTAFGGVVPGEFTLSIGDVSAGTNYLQILLEDHGGGTGYYVNVTGDVAPAPSPVPLPASGALMLAGLGALAARRRKKAKQ